MPEAQRHRSLLVGSLLIAFGQFSRRLTRQTGGEWMELRPPDLGQEVGRALTVEIDRLREFPDLGGQDGLRLETLLTSRLPKNCEVGAGDHGIDDLSFR